MFLFNDKPVNVEVTEIGQRAKRIYYYSKSDCFYMTLDAGNGKITRSKFFSNTDQPTAMPRLGSIIGNEMYMVGKTDRALAKSKLAIGKISIK